MCMCTRQAARAQREQGGGLEQPPMSPSLLCSRRHHASVPSSFVFSPEFAVRRRQGRDWQRGTPDRECGCSLAETEVEKKGTKTHTQFASLACDKRCCSRAWLLFWVFASRSRVFKEKGESRDSHRPHSKGPSRISASARHAALDQESPYILTKGRHEQAVKSSHLPSERGAQDPPANTRSARMRISARRMKRLLR